MDRRRPARLLAWGTGLAVAGWLMSFLLVLRVLPVGFALAFLSYALLLAGTLVGTVGAVEYHRWMRRER